MRTIAEIEERWKETDAWLTVMGEDNDEWNDGYRSALAWVLDGGEDP